MLQCSCFFTQQHCFAQKNAKAEKLLLPLFHYKFSWVHICNAKETITFFALDVTALGCVRVRLRAFSDLYTFDKMCMENLV